MKYIAGFIKTRMLCITGMVALILIEISIFAFGPENDIDLSYMLCLQFAIILILGCIDFGRFVRRTKRVEYNLCRDPKEKLDLPESDDALEEAFHNLLEYQMMDRNKLLVESKREDERMREYYNVWVHQIKTPLAAMNLLLQSGFDPEDENSVIEFRSDMENGLFTVEQYANMALQYQRLRSDSTDYVFETVALDKVIRDAIRKYAKLFIKKKLVLEYKGTDLTVVTDEKWLSFVIEQLLSNAIKYTNSGAVRIKAEKSGNVTQILIEDEGMGISEEDLPRVFEKGYTGYNGRADKSSTGIGLFLCKEILTRLNHSISITSVPKKGTTVKIEFIRID